MNDRAGTLVRLMVQARWCDTSAGAPRSNEQKAWVLQSVRGHAVYSLCVHVAACAGTLEARAGKTGWAPAKARKQFTHAHGCSAKGAQQAKTLAGKPRFIVSSRAGRKVQRRD
eukprot:2669908-Alexandrium_andersonii.AAC.1